MCTLFQEPQTASKLTTMLLAMADVRAVLVALAAWLARLRSAAALAGTHGDKSCKLAWELLQSCMAVQGCCEAVLQATAMGNSPCSGMLAF